VLHIYIYIYIYIYDISRLRVNKQNTQSMPVRTCDRTVAVTADVSREQILDTLPRLYACCRFPVSSLSVYIQMLILSRDN